MDFWQQDIKESVRDLNRLSQTTTDFLEKVPSALYQELSQSGNQHPLWKQFVPSSLENDSIGLADPIGDEVQLKAPQIIHRYPHQVLFCPTHQCPVICRFCFRKNELSAKAKIFQSDYKKTLDYLTHNTDIQEVIFTGGDPLMLSDEKLEAYLNDFSQIRHIKYIRFHTRTPIFIPSRITTNFLTMLNRFQQKFKIIQFVLHINQVEELNQESSNAFRKLQESNFLLLSQTVLLKGINDNLESLKNLFLNLSQSGIRPYYLHHPDQVAGADHFRISLEAGRQLYLKLRYELPGWACPQYIIDQPSGEGKVPAFNPENIKFSGKLLSPKSGELRPLKT